MTPHLRVFRHPAQQVVASALLVQMTLIVTGPLSVRLLGVEGRGVVAMVVATVLLVGQVMPWGVPQAFSYSIARGESDARGLISVHGWRYARNTLAAGVAGSALLALVTAFRPIDGRWAAMAIAFAGTLTTMVAVLVIACLQGASRFGVLALVQLIPATFYAVVMVLLVWVDYRSTVLVLVLYFAGWFAAGAIGLVVLLSGPDTGERAPGGSREVPSRERLRFYSRRAALAAAAPIDNLGIDQLAVAMLLGPHGLGLYVVAVAFRSPSSLVFSSVAGVCGTRVAGISDPRAAKRYCLRWLSVALGAGIVTAVGLELAVEFLLVPAFGSEASPAKLAATGLVLAGIPLGLRRVVYAMLQGLGQPGSASRAETIGLVVMLAGMVPLTAVMGVMGAVVANGAGATVAVVLALWTLMSTIRTSVSQDEIGV